jgi:PKD repeat protein
VVANSNGSNYLTVVAVYTGSPGSLLEIACETGFNPVGFQANVGEVYYIMVAAIPGGTGEWLEFSLTGASPPVADFSYWNAPEYGPHSVYFTNSSYDPDCYWCNLTAYWEFGDGSTSSELYPIHQYPSDGGYLVTLTVTTEDGRTGQLQQQVEVVTPPPDAHFYYYPGDPTTYDMVRFNYWFCSWCSVLWEFGDGSTSNEMNPIHQYAADGDYTVLLTVTDLVGQSASTTQLIRVKTIDVAVARFMVPQSAKAGQTRSVAVDISNTTYPVEVKVQLYKSNGQNWEWVGFLQQTVPVRPANRGTSFEFSYTFTQADALLGSINFRAVANLVNDRDAFPINNETISLPTKVMP